MKPDITIALIGIGGYGHYYLDLLLRAPQHDGFRIVAGIDPAPASCHFLAELQAAQIPIYHDVESFYAQSSADLAIISTPIHWHVPLIRAALAHGSHVLCEKPLTAVIQDACGLRNAAAASPQFVAIGYQWSFSDAIQALKQDIMAGNLGRPLRLKTKVFWPRPVDYFRRNSWAGRLKTDDGHWVLDSIVNNATAHYLHNMFYVLGATRETSAWPADVQAELYRANAIESYDAAALRCHTDNGAEVLFYAAHCTPTNINPIFRYEFEAAVVDMMPETPGRIVAHFSDGRVKDYGDPEATHANKLWQSIEAVRTGTPRACGIEASMPHTLCVNGAHESMPEIIALPEDLIRTTCRKDLEFIWVEELQEVFEQCYAQGILPSEHNKIPWAKPGNIINLRDYRYFPSSD